jgi:radical SAM superfamily enzyme YgiQ (UPF0313 family)
MRILLINPSINTKKFGKFHILMEPMPCIGLAYIAAVLEKDGHTVRIIDNYVRRHSIEKLVKITKKFSADILGISVLTPSVNFSLSLAKKLKQNNKNIVLIAGNVHPTLFPEEFLKQDCFDVVVRGEGEYTMSELVNAVSHNRELREIEGISYLKDGETVHNQKRKIIHDLDALPLPAWHLLPHKKYGLFPFADIKKPMLTLQASRGCPFNCHYCSLSYMDKTYRKRTPKNIVNEINYLIKNFKINQFGLVDPIFPLHEDYAVEVCNEIINTGINKKIVWTTETKIDLLNERLIKKLKTAGCRRIIFGLESGGQETLLRIGKKIDFSIAKETVRLLKKYNMESIGLFMIGLPGETKKSIKETFKYACSLDVDFAKFAMTVPFPGSKFYNTMKSENKIRTDNWDNFTTFNPNPDEVPYVPEGMTADQLIYLQRRGTIDFYFRPRMIYRQLFNIRTIKPGILLKGLYCLFPV